MFDNVLICLFIFVALLAGLEVGRWVGLKRPGEAEGSASAQGVVFAVLGLLIAFTFTSAAGRYDVRRNLVVQQTNAIGTAWLRVDLLAEADRRPIWEAMSEWTDLAIAVVTERDRETMLAEMQRAAEIQYQVWDMTVAALERQNMPPHAVLVLTPINQWIDLSTTRTAQDQMGLPPLVLPTLVLLAVLGSVLAGVNMAKGKNRKPLHMVAYAGALTFSIFVILDLYDAREGLIQVAGVDAVMIAQGEYFKADLAAEAP